MYHLKINDQEFAFDVADPNTPLLWVLRDELGLVGAKYGCGIGQCGACMVLVDGQPNYACLIPAARLQGREITTVEGLAGADGKLNALQQAWIDLDVPQCGYCQAGQLISATALLQKTPNPTDAEIDEAMRANLCRCGTYTRIRQAIRLAAKQLATGESAT